MPLEWLSPDARVGVRVVAVWGADAKPHISQTNNTQRTTLVRH